MGPALLGILSELGKNHCATIRWQWVPIITGNRKTSWLGELGQSSKEWDTARAPPVAQPDSATAF